MNFYLGPENIFLFKGRPINYLVNPGIPVEKGSWYAKSEGFTYDSIPELSREQVEDVAMELSHYFKPQRWAITVDYRCNYHCPMCPIHGNGYEDGAGNDYMAVRQSQKRVFPKEEAFRIIDIVSSKNIKCLNLSMNGELFFYPHWEEVAKYASRKGMEVGTISNGALINDQMGQAMKNAGIKSIRISLDALSFETYSKVRSAKKEHFEAAMQAPGLLKKLGFNVNVHFVKQWDNIHEAQEFLEYWKTKEVDSISIANQLVYHNGVSTDVIIDGSARERLKDDEFIHGICSKYGNFVTLLSGTVVGCCEMVGLYTDNGSCGLPVLNLEKNSFEQLVESMNQLMSKKDSPLYPVCKKCPLYTFTVVEEEHEGWNVNITKERETWIRKK